MIFLNDIRVLDLCDEKGSFCSKLLADFGAEVVKLEKPGGDSSRMTGPFFGNSPHPEKSISFFYNNTNKSGITLNIESKEGRDIFAKLLENTDIIVESFGPGYLDSLGLGFDYIQKKNPGVIMASITGFGQTGPEKNRKSCDLTISASGGQMYVSGSPSMPPLKPYGEQTYYTGSLYAVIGIFLALRKKRNTGSGEHIDISLQESAVSGLDHVMIRYFHEQIVSERHGNRHWNNFFRILRCKDGFIHLTPFQQWDILIAWMESDGMAGDLAEEKWKDEAYRMSHADHIIRIMEEWTMTYSVHDLFKSAQDMQFPWAPVDSPEQVLESRQLKDRGFFNNVEDPELSDKARYPGLPYKYRIQSPFIHKRAPRIGEHNILIYGNLGMSPDDLERLSCAGII